jgi:hypothetical protein
MAGISMASDTAEGLADAIGAIENTVCEWVFIALSVNIVPARCTTRFPNLAKPNTKT